MGRAFNVVLERTVRELDGQPCIPLELHPPARQQIVVSRSFGSLVSDPNALREAVVTHAQRAAEKLRHQHLAASVLHVFAHTNPFRAQDPQYHGASTVTLPHPTQDARVIARHAVTGLRRLYRTGYRYQKAGVMLLELTSPTAAQGDLFQETLAQQDSDRSLRLMAVLDGINRQIGRGTLFLASQGGKHKAQPWHLRRDMRSPRYTTDWGDLAAVR